MLPSELTNAIEQFIVYDRNEAHFTYICVYHTNVFEADNIYKNPLPNAISPKKNLFFSLWGSTYSTYDSADCWSAHRPPSVRDSFKRVHDWWRLGGVG